MRPVSVVKIPAPEIPKFQAALACLVRQSASAIFPGGGPRIPTAIWISEIMLQQTRVAAVIPYYENFLARFPTVQSLARARAEAVLSHWAGLGITAAPEICIVRQRKLSARHGGQFPARS